MSIGKSLEQMDSHPHLSPSLFPCLHRGRNVSSTQQIVTSSITTWTSLWPQILTWKWSLCSITADVKSRRWWFVNRRELHNKSNLKLDMDWLSSTELYLKF
jgi:hypothetical protein